MSSRLILEEGFHEFQGNGHWEKRSFKSVNMVHGQAHCPANSNAGPKVSYSRAHLKGAKDNTDSPKSAALNSDFFLRRGKVP